jgi:hypothetical protein
LKCLYQVTKVSGRVLCAMVSILPHFIVRFWNCSDCVAFFVFLDFGTVPTVWHFLFFQIMELFRQCGIFCFSRFWNCSDSVAFFVFPEFGTVPTVWYFLFFQILELFRQCGIIFFHLAKL